MRTDDCGLRSVADVASEVATAFYDRDGVSKSQCNINPDYANDITVEVTDDGVKLTQYETRNKVYGVT